MRTNVTPDAQATVKPRIQLSAWVGTVCNWSQNQLDVDALTAPMGLSGSYKVFGIDPHPEAVPPSPTPPHGNYEHKDWPAIFHQWCKDRRLASAFEMMLSPHMTPLHVVRAAALEHDRRQGDCCVGHIYFESITVHDGGIIELEMGS